jgi:glutamate N-acetyltransferase/amino-acid N-acetyltransferase
MATMLAFLATNASIRPSLLNRALRSAVEESFNRVTVDECQSTSDTVAVLANGMSEAAPIAGRTSASFKRLAAALSDLCGELAYQIAADGEGAERVIEVKVRGAASPADAHEVARAIAVSPLVRTAVHGADPNWGRIIQSLGTTRAAFDPNRIVVRICDQTVFRRGRPSESADMAKVSRKMKAKHVLIEVDLKERDGCDRVLTCDLTKGYITINADYHT